MKVMAVNGSPRKAWNTATLLKKALKGAASQGAETELVHLYDLNFKGCISYFACKTRGGKSYGRCAVKDDLKPLFKKIEAADALMNLPGPGLASPAGSSWWSSCKRKQS
jgi:multimeric flavodoxin WrbA